MQWPFVKEKSYQRLNWKTLESSGWIAMASPWKMSKCMWKSQFLHLGEIYLKRSYGAWIKAIVMSWLTNRKEILQIPERGSLNRKESLTIKTGVWTIVRRAGELILEFVPDVYSILWVDIEYDWYIHVEYFFCKNVLRNARVSYKIM